MALLGSGSKGRTNNPKFGPAGSARTSPNAYVGINPSIVEPSAPDAVQQRQNAALQGKMLHDQLKKNKSGSSPL
jgi:hypothetical protein